MIIILAFMAILLYNQGKTQISIMSIMDEAIAFLYATFIPVLYFAITFVFQKPGVYLE